MRLAVSAADYILPVSMSRGISVHILTRYALDLSVRIDDFTRDTDLFLRSLFKARLTVPRDFRSDRLSSRTEVFGFSSILALIRATKSGVVALLGRPGPALRSTPPSGFSTF